MVDNLRNFLDRTRTLLSDLRRAKSSTTSNSANGTTTAPSLTSSTPGPDKTYKPFIKRLEPPTFSGRIEDWPEFRSVWQDLLAEFPESVQVQHLKTNIPEADAKRVAGVKTMEESGAG